ncbi:hypothetical protein BE11_40095 [Sorangium cellulosum]|nr:hypothetical protein BE11_40095 [Sorangium cellulosum]
MPKSGRAFRALARAQPDVIAGLLAAVAPGLLPPGAALLPDDVAPTHLDGLPSAPPLEREADVYPPAEVHGVRPGKRAVRRPRPPEEGADKADGLGVS